MVTARWNGSERARLAPMKKGCTFVVQPLAILESYLGGSKSAGSLVAATDATDRKDVIARVGKVKADIGLIAL